MYSLELDKKAKKRKNNPIEHHISPLCPAGSAWLICTMFGTYGQTTNIIIQVKF